MAIFQSDHVKGIKDVPYPAVAGMVCAARFAMSVPANFALNDIFELAVIPAGCRVVDIVAFDCDDLDSNGTPTLSLDVGIMSGEAGDPNQSRTCGAEFVAGATIGRTGGVVEPSIVTAFRTGRANIQRAIGVKVAAAAATPQAGTIGLTVLYAAE
ncbi:hypothetical protein [Phreatobacter oligotrophus]|uniref:Uncharacterized protein n=1 Tax=Phreatobacter oligotrophus TaxID=1122261 RepID=A0A2T4ZIT3_9HYPH|nr:hypothetical protein [Phreatobacter oligotrophus]PTM61897.1 hypothetical protein C8P69_101569 [Phreatobacter oligotrophus]